MNNYALNVAKDRLKILPLFYLPLGQKQGQHPASKRSGWQECDCVFDEVNYCEVSKAQSLIVVKLS